MERLVSFGVDFNDTLTPTREKASLNVVASSSAPVLLLGIKDPEYRAYLRELSLDPRRLYELEPAPDAKEALEMLNMAGEVVLVTSFLTPAEQKIKEWLGDYRLLPYIKHLCLRSSAETPSEDYKIGVYRGKYSLPSCLPLVAVFDDDMEIISRAARLKLWAHLIDLYQKYFIPEQPGAENVFGPFHSLKLASSHCLIHLETHGPHIT